ncbi:MAG: GtrA family protein [bacterium]|nr:GtrA family protein [bacterium]
MGDSKKDYKASLLLGALAAVLSKTMIDNIGLSQKIINFLHLDLSPSFVTILIMIFIFIACPVGIFIARLIGKKSMSVYQIIKFGETGGLNTFVDMGIFNLLIFATGTSTGFIVSIGFKGISFITAVINSYFWNKHWVFESKAKNKSGEREFAKFMAVSAGGFIVNISVASLILTLAKRSGVNSIIMANIAGFAAIALTMVWNFLGYKLVVFVKPKKK